MPFRRVLRDLQAPAMFLSNRLKALIIFIILVPTIPLLDVVSTLSSPHFVLEFEQADAPLASKILQYSERSFRQVSGQLNHTPTEKIRIVLCSSTETFNGMTKGKLPEWGVAFAIVSENLIILKSPRLLKRNVNFTEVVTHEVAHIILHSFVGKTDIPRWLNEGFAMYQSKEWKIGNSWIVGRAALSNSLLDLSDLEVAFPRSEEKANLAYTESFLAVAYIIQQYGSQGLSKLLQEMKSNGDMDQATRKAMGIGYQRFKRDWMEYTKNRFSIASFILSPGTVWSTIIVLLIVVFVTRHQRNKRKLVTMDGDNFSFHEDGDVWSSTEEHWE